MVVDRISRIDFVAQPFEGSYCTMNGHPGLCVVVCLSFAPLRRETLSIKRGQHLRAMLLDNLVGTGHRARPKTVA